MSWLVGQWFAAAVRQARIFSWQRAREVSVSNRHLLCTPVLAKNRMSATPSGPIPVYSRRREGFSSPEILPPTPCSLKMRVCCAEAGAGADRRSMCGIVAWMEQGHFQGSLQELLGLSSTICMLVRPCCLQAKQFVLDSEED